ncbi:GTPase-activating protein [Steccherinum ochraceum]|uniref:GTPase-activating protein n=1 Tax=Steccherinum ochraceum TaxID=92696 RepID=A0A4R0RVE6_9APHY|nr:GTPase-activating protein [Steccherinum ochraceum]
MASPAPTASNADISQEPVVATDGQSALQENTTVDLLEPAKEVSDSPEASAAPARSEPPATKEALEEHIEPGLAVDTKPSKPENLDLSEAKHLASPTSVATPTPAPLTISSTQPASSPLDALLSPKSPEATFEARQSVAMSEATDDDGRFSTVLLSARQSLDTDNLSLNGSIDPGSLSTLVEEGLEHDGKRNTLSSLEGSELIRMVHTNRQHKKTASTSTIVSASNVPFLLARVDAQGDEGLNRRSLDGQQKLQEDFNRMQLESEPKAQDTKTVPVEIDWDFWGDVVSDYPKFAAERPSELAKAIERGIPKTLRGMIWQLMSASKDPELEQTYLRLLKEPSTHEKAINRDLGRTFPHHAFFTDGHGIGQENLFNVLKAYSLYDPQVGYCQGLPFVVAILLLNMPDEEAFCLLVRMMHSYDIRGHFLPEMPKLTLRLFQFDRLVEEILPVLHVHFIRQGIKSTMYCSQWFLTMFSYRFPMDIVFRIFDNCLASGIEAMFAFSIILLYKNEEKLLAMKLDEMISFLNTKVFDIYQLPKQSAGGEESTIQYDVDQFVQDAVSLRITPFQLDNYAHEYDESVRIRDAHAIEMDALRASNRTLSSQVNRLEANLAQLNTEHCEVLNELVRARLRNEELEGELVRYKLLYAEAMHHNMAVEAFGSNAPGIRQAKSLHKYSETID